MADAAGRYIVLGKVGVQRGYAFGITERYPTAYGPPLVEGTNPYNASAGVGSSNFYVDVITPPPTSAAPNAGQATSLTLKPVLDADCMRYTVEPGTNAYVDVSFYQPDQYPDDARQRHRRHGRRRAVRLPAHGRSGGRGIRLRRPRRRSVAVGVHALPRLPARRALRLDRRRDDDTTTTTLASGGTTTTQPTTACGALSSFAGVRCVCAEGVAPAACAADHVPAAVGKLFGRACGAMQRAADLDKARQVKKAVRLAAADFGKVLGKVTQASRAKRHALSPACSAALTATVGDAQQRTSRIRAAF